LLFSLILLAWLRFSRRVFASIPLQLLPLTRERLRHKAFQKAQETAQS
jgi:hypothetical protein